MIDKYNFNANVVTKINNPNAEFKLVDPVDYIVKNSEHNFFV